MRDFLIRFAISLTLALTVPFVIGTLLRALYERAKKKVIRLIYGR